LRRSGLATAILVFVVLASTQGASAEEPSCPFPNEQPMLVTQLFFGTSIKGRGPITAKEWTAFVRRDVAPRFPDGFTVYEAQGEWLNPLSHSVVREKSKVMIIATADTAQARTSITEVSELYRKAFRQQSVGVITRRECAAF
jgi:hypothetical protein